MPASAKHQPMEQDETDKRTVMKRQPIVNETEMDTSDMPSGVNYPNFLDSLAGASKLFNFDSGLFGKVYSSSPTSSPSGFYVNRTYMVKDESINYKQSPISAVVPALMMSPSTPTVASKTGELLQMTDQKPKAHPLYLPEILTHIFSFLETNMNTGTDPTQPLDFVKVDSIKYSVSKPKLYYCALVSKLWNACATKLLWKNVKIGSAKACNRLMRTLMSPSGGMVTVPANQFMDGNQGKRCWGPAEEQCLFHEFHVFSPSQINGWVYGKLIKSFTLIPPHNPAADSTEFIKWDVDSLVVALARSCPNLEDLNLSTCAQVMDESIIAVARHCPNLQKLNLNRCDQVSTLAVLELAKYCKNLKIFNLSRPLLAQQTTISDDSLFQLVHRLENVMELRLRNCDLVTDRTIMKVAETCKLNLLAIDLSWCGRLTDKAICQGIGLHCHNLKSLALNGCKKLTDRSIATLLTYCPNISSISLAHLPFITDTVLTDMAPQLRNLVILSLNGCNNVGDDSIRALVEHCRKLKSLSLFSLKITDIAVIEVAEKCTELVSLSISGCTRVKDRGAVRIRNLNKLQSLYLNGADITDRTMLAIASNCMLLRALSLNDCVRLTDSSIAALTNSCVQIQSLSMNGCNITVVGIKALVDRLPDLRELSIKGCPLCTLTGDKSYIETKGNGVFDQIGAVGSEVFHLMNKRRIAIMYP